MNLVNVKMLKGAVFTKFRNLFLRYEQAKNISQDLEKQAARVHEEAKRAGDKAVEIYASVAQLAPVDAEALEVRTAWLSVLSPLVCVRASDCPAPAPNPDSQDS